MLSSELHARHWTTRLVGPSAGTSSILRGSEHPVQIRTGAGDRTALWQAPSFGNRSTRTRRTRGRIRGGRPLTVTVREGRRRIVTAVTGGRLRGARIGTAETGTVAAAGGRAERGEETDVETIVAPDARGARAVRRITRPEAPEASERRGRNGNDRISKGCLEPQPWARRATGRPRVETVGTLLGARPPAEQSRLQPVMVMRSPRVKVASLPRDVASPVR